MRLGYNTNGLCHHDLVQAIELLAQPKTRGRGAAAAREPLKVFEASPVTEEPIKLLEGRYGPYVTDGTTNASIPKGATPEDVTFEHALQLLAERAARAPAKKKKKAAKKKTSKKTTSKKTETKKKAVSKEKKASSTKKKVTTSKSATKKTAKKTPKKAAAESQTSS